MTPWSQSKILEHPVEHYGAVRPGIPTGALVFTSGSYFVSRAIRYFTNSPWSHVGFLAWVEGRLLVIESVEDHGVRFAPLSRYLTDYRGLIVVAVPDLNALQVKHAIGYAIDRLTTPYGYGQMAAILARIVTGFGRGPSSQGLICSELVGESLAAAGFFVNHSVADYATPEDVWCDPRVKYVARLK